jgi:hypothetical protein
MWDWGNHTDNPQDSGFLDLDLERHRWAVGDTSSCPGRIGSERPLRRNSGHSGDDLCIGREATNSLLRAGNTVIDNDLKDAPARTREGHLRIWSDFADEVRRRTGARFIVSLAAVFDFDSHRYHPLLCRILAKNI